MAQDYVILNDENELGMIAINKSVIQSIAQISIDEIENSIQVPSARFTKPLSIRIDKNKLNISADIKVRYGANVQATCELVQNKIYENIRLMTGFKANDIAINVMGFEF